MEKYIASSCCFCIELRHGVLILATIGLIHAFFSPVFLNSGFNFFAFCVWLVGLALNLCGLHGAVRFNLQTIGMFVAYRAAMPILDFIMGTYFCFQAESRCRTLLAENSEDGEVADEELVACKSQMIVVGLIVTSAFLAYGIFALWVSYSFYYKLKNNEYYENGVRVGITSEGTPTFYGTTSSGGYESRAFGGRYQGGSYNTPSIEAKYEYGKLRPSVPVGSSAPKAKTAAPKKVQEDNRNPFNSL